MNTLEFLQTMYGKATSGYLTVWTMPDKRTAYFPITEPETALRYAESRFESHDVYYGMGLRREKLSKNKRGSNGDVSLVPAFWSDIDVKGAAHKESELPETTEIALEFLNSLPLKPSVTVASGNGLHVYWLFAEPLSIMTDAHRKNIANALAGWQKYINTVARECGWKLDNTSDLARILRLPGGVNHKLDNGTRATIISVNENRYEPSDFKPFIQIETTTQVNTSAKTSEQSATFNAAVGDSNRILEKCAFMRYCCDNAAVLSEPYWHVMVSNIALCSDGRNKCHELSKPYPNYSVTETDKKIEYSLKERKPHTCEYIRNSLGFDCGVCMSGCKAPISLAIITKAEIVRELLERDIGDWSVIFDEDYIEALSYAKSQMSADYAKFKAKARKAKVSLQDLENCLKDYNSRHRQQHTTSDGEPLNLDNIDLNGAIIPKKWQVSIEGGVRRTINTKDGENEIVACPDAVVITRRLVNIDDGKERLELSFHKDGRWKSVTGGRTQIYNKASILGFGDDGLHVTSGTAAELVSYLSDYEIVNKNVIPRTSSIARLGWLSDSEFFPYAINENIMFEDDKGTSVLFNNLTEHGDYGRWKEMMRELRKNPISRFMTSASFASPLLCKIGARTFVIHLWVTSGAGKTAALKAAISVWGNPLRIAGNGFTTVVGTEQLAGTLRNLPFGIDEKQSVDDKRLSLEHLVYVLGQGSGKIRGAKGGGNANVATWHNIIMLTGEEPITRNSSLDGIQTRTFEIYGKPIDDIEFAKEVHIISENDYGFAGAVFMKAICGILKENSEYLKQKYSQISAEYKAHGLKNVHADYVSAVTLGDFLAETIIFGTDSDTAMKEAMLCGETVYKLNEAQMSTDSVERAWDFVTGWLVGNEQKFSSEASTCFGRISESPGGCYMEYFVIPQYLDIELEKAGFNIKKTFQGFKERGFIETQTDSEGKTRTKTLGRVNDKVLRGYAFRVKRDGIKPCVKDGID